MSKESGMLRMMLESQEEDRQQAAEEQRWSEKERYQDATWARLLHETAGNRALCVLFSFALLIVCALLYSKNLHVPGYANWPARFYLQCVQILLDGCFPVALCELCIRREWPSALARWELAHRRGYAEQVEASNPELAQELRAYRARRAPGRWPRVVAGTLALVLALAWPTLWQGLWVAERYAYSARMRPLEAAPMPDTASLLVGYYGNAELYCTDYLPDELLAREPEQVRAVAYLAEGRTVAKTTRNGIPLQVGYQYVSVSLVDRVTGQLLVERTFTGNQVINSGSDLQEGKYKYGNEPSREEILAWVREAYAECYGAD